MENPTQERKIEQLRICCERDVEFQTKTTLFEDVDFVGTALPEIGPAEVDLSVEFLGRRLRAPILIGAATGGTPEGRRINRDLARVAAEFGIGLALGSQRAMLDQPDLADTYQVRDVAPDILLLGNIGLSQAGALSADQAEALMTQVGADGLCLHLNAAMELTQPEGQRTFANSLATVRALAGALGERLIVKETGCGIGWEDGVRLKQAGVRTVDVAGAGGTSWPRVERLRAGETAEEAAAAFDEWGLPTAVCLIELRRSGLRLIASGGLRTGLDFAKGLALGATLCSAALPFVRAQQRGGVEAVRRYVQSLIDGLRTVAVLTGCRNVAGLRAAPLVIVGRLRERVGGRA